MLQIPLCRPRVIMRLESIGITNLDDLAGRDPSDLIEEINLEAGRIIWRPPIATQALTNLVDAASRNRHTSTQHLPRRPCGCGP